MALFLIMGQNHTNPDPVKEQRGCYKRGDIVAVYDDSAHDGNLTLNPIQPPFFLILVTGVTKAQGERFVQSATLATDGTERRRRHRVMVDDVPQAVRDQLATSRYAEFTWTQVRNFVQNKLTLATQAGLNPDGN